MSSLRLIFLLTTTILVGVSCRGFRNKENVKKLFLSRRVVTDTREFDGGVLVDENGIISGIYTRKSAENLLHNDGSLQVIDGGHWALMAGVVDSHVHVNEPGRTSWEGYVTATKAAAAGGITTLVDMPLIEANRGAGAQNVTVKSTGGGHTAIVKSTGCEFDPKSRKNSIPPTTTVENLKVKVAAAKEEVYIDVAFWGGVVPGNENELQNMISAGVIGFKAYLIDSGIEEYPNVKSIELDDIFSTLNGSDVVIAFHAELPVSNSVDNSQCEKCDCPDPNLYSTYLASHPPEMEMKAASLLASYIPKYDVRVHVVHVSAAGVIPILEQAREERIKAGSTRWRGGVTAETCHHYLTFSSEQIPPGHTEFKCSPPIRNLTNKQQLWEYIKDRRIDLIASDHSPSVASLKGPNFMTAWGGVSSVQFGLSLFWTEAKARGYSLSTVSHYLSAGPANMVGLQNRKGALKPGLDADLVFFDPEASFVVRPEIILYKNKLSPYMQRILNGKVMKTYLRGQQIYSNGEDIQSPAGQLLINADVLSKL